MKVEIAIALFNSHGGIEEGDIIVCRKPSAGIGKKESKGFLWFRADISEALAKVIKKPLLDEKGNKVKKHRYSIALSTLKDINTNLDLEKSIDLKTEYQPYLPIDKDMLFIDPAPETFALETLEIVWDKGTGAYI